MKTPFPEGNAGINLDPMLVLCLAFLFVLFCFLFLYQICCSLGQRKFSSYCFLSGGGSLPTAHFSTSGSFLQWHAVSTFQLIAYWHTRLQIFVQFPRQPHSAKYLSASTWSLVPTSQNIQARKYANAKVTRREFIRGDSHWRQGERLG